VDTEEMRPDATESKSNWNEEYDAWLELIEDHLKNIRRLMVIMLAVMVVTAISVMVFAYFVVNTILHPFPQF
jgi:hypothetical protein